MLFYITGGVGFVLCILAIVLIFIFHAKYKSKVLPVIIFALGFVVFMGSGFMHWRGLNAELPDKDSADDTQISENDDSSGGLSVDRGLFNVDVTIPASLFQGEDMSAFDEKAYAEENGYSKAKVNDDGSVTVTMSKGDYNKIVKELADQYDQTFSEMVDAEDTPYIKNITRSKNFDEITIEVDRDAYENAFDLSPFFVGVAGLMYQVFDGDALHTDVIVKDAATGETIHSVTYPDAWESSGDSSSPSEEGNTPDTAEPDAQDTANAPDAAPTSGSAGNLGDYYVEVKEAKIVNDYDGNPAVVITYSWTNNSEDTTSAEVVLMEKAFQDGVQLSTAFIGDYSVYNSELSFKELRPGTTFDVQCAFELTSESSEIEFEVSELFSLSNATVTQNFDPNELQ